MTSKPRSNRVQAKKTRSFRGLWYFFFLSIIFVIGGAGLHYYRYFFQSNISTGSEPFAYLYIPTGSDFAAVTSLLEKNHWLKDLNSFDWVAHKKKYDLRVKPGKYKIPDGMNNNELVNMLRSGRQEPVKLILQNVRSVEEIAGRISSQIEADSLSILNLFRDPVYLQEFGAEPSTAFCLIIPNTYEFYWNTSADRFIRRMVRERQKFWNDERLTRMSSEGFDIPQVITLASIIEKETVKDSEKPLIAGVYMNRLRRNWPLQADPTLIYAWNDYTIKRVLNKHKMIDSPYNTYIHTGLPPGPICLPSVSSIDAVLNYEQTSYMYFCAKEDISGYHNFSVTLAEHTRNAERYQAALKKLNIP